MARILLAAAAIVTLPLLSVANAQTTTTTVITEQPVTSTTVVEVPAEVRTYVTKQEMSSVVLEGPVTVGTPLPDTIQYQVIPEHDDYAYAVVNGQRVIIDPKTRSVIEVYD
jgi:hypothetical protein